jgi:serine protease inhibitor
MSFDGDVTSALSANSMVGEKINSNDTEKYESKMLLFNGLYFRGAWAHPFQVNY